MISRSLLRAGAAASTVCLFWLAGGTSSSRAQSAAEPSPSPNASPKAKYGYIRFWNLLPNTASRLELSTVGDAQGKALLIAGPGTFQPAYRAVLPARYSWLVSPPGEHQTPLKTLANVAVGPDVYVTIVARPSDTGGTEPIIEVINDTPDPAASAGNELRVYQISPDAKAIVTANRTAKGDPLAYGGTQVIKDLPKGNVPVSISIVSKAGTGIWNTEADFRRTSHATLVVLADVYGRIRPRVTNDGPPRGSEAPENLVPTAPASTPPPFPR